MCRFELLGTIILLFHAIFGKRGQTYNSKSPCYTRSSSPSAAIPLPSSQPALQMHPPTSSHPPRRPS
ncbi:hypothetical protein O988_04981 [Pseudogymnoascus sp. VKM F-3808]|nr:hypothetical protein V490_08612 [Pseudogymnoascus sp. VKM F-3557]KFX97187.1 hypothetical protein O988_04981 [Pseudogymnoascus sp. VKM F-3808]